MEKGQENQNFDCDVKPETELERMKRHTDQGEMERRADWQWRGDPGHCQGLGRRKVRGLGFAEALRGWYRLLAMVTAAK